ncbi:MAG: hypothetical protein Q9O62_11970 [Ardenticatenia bacterium]|nr:hypothetical protein [Ardenticatenia bacterium]
MKKIVANIEGIRERQSSRGQPFWVVEYRGPDGIDSAYLWSTTLRQRLDELAGQRVALTIEMRGEWPRITGVEPAEPTGASPSASRSAPDSRGEDIARAVALKAAAQVLQGTGADSIAVLEMASAFLAWLRDPEAAMGEAVMRHARQRGADEYDPPAA